MDRRRRILLALFGAAVGYALLSGVVYPNWIQPLMTIDDRIAERKKELDKLEGEQARADKARYDYKAWVERLGSFSADHVETKVRDRLNQLIAKHQMQDATVAPSRPDTDRKTGLTMKTITFSGTSSLEAAVGFLKDAAEMPELVRLGNVSLYPAAAGRKGADKDRMNLRVPIELLVLPQHPIVGRIAEASLTQPPSFVRHEGRDYTLISSGKPFSDYVPPIPLKAEVKTRAINVEIHQPAILEGSASGGDGQYTFAWSPSDGLSEPTSPRTSVDTSAAFSTRAYTLTVTDGLGKSATTTVSVTVKEPKKEVVAEVPPEVKPPTPPPPPRDPSWPDAKFLQLVSIWLRKSGAERTDEVMVFNTKSRLNQYYKVGADFDGGELIFVHQTGALARRKDNNEYLAYPLGSMLDQRVDARHAVEYPSLKSAADRYEEALRQAQEAALREKEAAEAKAREEAEVKSRQEAEAKAADAAGRSGESETKGDSEAKPPQTEDVQIQPDGEVAKEREPKPWEDSPAAPPQVNPPVAAEKDKAGSTPPGNEAKPGEGRPAENPADAAKKAAPRRRPVRPRPQ